MANLIRLKQIESSSFLEAAGAVGQDFSQSVINIITTEVQGVLPDGVVSGSIQIVELGFQTTASFHQYTASLGDTFATDYEVYVTSSQIIDQGEW
jgi:hypothetical protein